MKRPTPEQLPTVVTVRLELSPYEAGVLHHFIGSHVAAYHGYHTSTILTDLRRRLLGALKDAGVLS